MSVVSLIRSKPTPPLSSMKFDSMFFVSTDWWIHHWAAARQMWDVHLMRSGRSFRPSQPQTTPQIPHRDAPRVTRTRNETCRAQAWPQLSLRMGQTICFYSHSCLQLKVSEASLKPYYPQTLCPPGNIQLKGLCTLKNKYDLTFCQSRLHTASNFRMLKKIRIRFDFLIRSMHFDRKGWEYEKTEKRMRKFWTQCAKALIVYHILMLPQKFMRNVVLCHKSIY